MNTISQQVQALINNKTKPPGSLGRLEDVALQVATIQRTCSPSIIQPHVIVFAADHGIAACRPVSPFPQQVTMQMVNNFLAGGAAISVFCRLHDIALTIVDAGVNADLSHITAHNLVHAKIAYGTSSYDQEDAMTDVQVPECIESGKKIVIEVKEKTGCNCIALGEMGIGNTSSASLIMSSVLGISIRDCIGRGTGSSDEQLKTKCDVLTGVFAFHRLDSVGGNPVEILRRVGGFEIAMMAGAYLQAWREDMVIVVDGFISTAALLIAQLMEPAVLRNCVFSHKSGENGHARVLDALNARPLLDLGMRLGEGTGAALAIPLIRSAVCFLNEMASFDSAGVSNKNG